MMKIQALFILVIIALLSACLPSPDDKGEPGPTPPVRALARIDALPLVAQGDTQRTTFTYDANGMKVRERFSFITWEWDSLGRYVRWTQHDHRDTNEVSTWVTADSSVRGSPGSTLKIAERWFGLRPNCRCADSVYRYGYNGSLLHIRRYTYDMHGNLTLVTRDFANPARRDTAQRYENTYVGDELVSRRVYDAEAEDSTRQFFVYASLESLQEGR
jgi:hypothetical protein